MSNFIRFTDNDFVTFESKINMLPQRKLIRETKALNKRIRKVVEMTGCDLATANKVVLSKLQK